MGEQAKQVEQLTPVDLLMPRIYVIVTLTFRTTQSTVAVIDQLQPGLDQLAKQIPWLSGRVFSTVGSSPQGKRPPPAIRWSSSDPAPQLMDKGTIAASYEEASAKGMPLVALPREAWPVPGMVDDFPSKTGAPVFAASLFRFADGEGIGLCVCIHHYAVDATALGEIIRLWARNVASVPASMALGPKLPIAQDRCVQLKEVLLPDLSAVSAQSTDEIWASHPEYSQTLPVFPSESIPPCSAKLFKIPIKHITSQRDALKKRFPDDPSPTTNTLVTVLIWAAITNARIQRDASLATKETQLAMAVNVRPRISKDFSLSDNPYFGNAVLTSVTRITVAELCHSLPKSPAAKSESETELQALSKITSLLTSSTAQITPEFVAEVYTLADRTADYTTIYAGWDLFNSRDLIITSWASLDLYETDFGGSLNKPEFVRVPPSEMDGICGVLPRRRVAEGEVLEVVVALREGDMGALLECDGIWDHLAEEVV